MAIEPPKVGIQTSFIPKKPLVSYGGKQSSGISGIINFIAIIVFVIAIAVYGGSYLYKTSINSSIASITSQLTQMKTELESRDSFMKEMIRFDTKLNTIGSLLDNHTSLRKIFDFLEETTMKNLRFSEFGYTNKDNQTIDLRMGGEAGSYATIALEAKEFFDAKKSGDKDYTDVIFSDLNPNLTGNVVFKVSATVRPDLVLYSNLDQIANNF